MKKILPVLFLFVFIIAGSVAYAQTSEEKLPNPGILPDNPFYFLDRWGKSLSLALTFNEQSRGQKQLRYAEERLAEAQAMADKGKEDLAEEAAESYGEYIGEAAKTLAAAAQDGQDVDRALEKLIIRTTAVHLTVLAEVYKKVPEQAKKGIEQAMSATFRGQDNALQAVSTERRDDIRQLADQKQLEAESLLKQESRPVPAVNNDRPEEVGQPVSVDNTTPNTAAPAE